MKNTKLSIILIGIAFLGINYASQAQAWTGPSALPPDGNVSAPINASTFSQTKAGFLQLTASLASGTASNGFAFSVPNAASWFSSLGVGGLGIFGMSTGGSAYIGNGAEGLFGSTISYALRAKNNINSDISFQTYNGASTNMIIKNDGKIGIGTITPSQKLEVSGGAIKATGGLIIETRTAAQGDPASPETGRMWLMVP
jgi:hypothetical protein